MREQIVFFVVIQELHQVHIYYGEIYDDIMMIDCVLSPPGCWKPFCPVTFHLPCSLGQEVVNRHDIFMSSCWQHSRRQDRPGGGAGHMCGVCGWTVHPGPSFSTLVSVCCNKIHHRDCIQVIRINICN